MIDIEARQQAKKQQLLAVKDVLDDMGVEFWLHSGVLLGYYRERDLIKHDPDLDLGVLRKNLPPDFTYRLARRLEGSEMRIGWETASCLKIYPDGEPRFEGSHCDIFLHDEVPGAGLALRLETDEETVDYFYPITGFVKTTFLGTEFLVPDNIREVLNVQYGPDWETPKTEFVWDKDPKNIVDGTEKLKYDETPGAAVIPPDLDCGLVSAVLGPVTEKDVQRVLKGRKYANLDVYALQAPGKSLPRVQYIRCDETHPKGYGLYDTVVVTHPEGYNEHNLRTLLRHAQDMLAFGGTLHFIGTPPDCIGEFMFERCGPISWKRYKVHPNWEKNVTAVVVTYESHKMAEECVASIRRNHPNMRILLVDNSKNPKPVNGSRLIPVPENIGLSYSRNAGVLEVNTPFVFLNDDDQWLENDVAVKLMYESVVLNHLDIVGGDTINSRTGLPAKYVGLIEKGVRHVSIQDRDRGTFPDGTRNVDLTLNFFVTRTEALRKVKWKNELKICEHLDFFMRAQKEGLKVGHLHSAICKHVKGPGARNTTYTERRRNTDHFRRMMMRMNGINKVDQFGRDVVSYGKPPAPKPGQPPKQVRPIVKSPNPRRKSMIETFPQLFMNKKKAPG